MAPPIEPSHPSDVESELDYYRRRVHALETAVRGALAVLSVADDDEIAQPLDHSKGGEQS